MQVAIDNAKRRFDINLTEEIKRIKKDMDIKTYKYPSFWAIVKKNFNKKNINNMAKAVDNKYSKFNIL